MKPACYINIDYLYTYIMDSFIRVKLITLYYNIVMCAIKFPNKLRLNIL